ncbi:hypothetical protein [Uruburuella suis]|nr:hypothetical protein [Uruburuella suis]
MHIDILGLSDGLFQKGRLKDVMWMKNSLSSMQTNAGFKARP